MRKRRGESIAAASASNSCTFRTASGGSGFRSAWNRKRRKPDRARILELLVRAEIFEQVLQTRYLGTKRYSLEGEAALLPLLDAILNAASEQGAEKAMLAMSHRGRLNVMVHIVGRGGGGSFSRDSRTWTRAACWAAAT